MPEQEAIDTVHGTWFACHEEGPNDGDMELIFVNWCREVLPDLTSSWLDGAAESVVEKAAYLLLRESSYFQDETTCDALRQRLHHLRHTLDNRDPARPHRPVRHGPIYRRGSNKVVPESHQRYLDHDRWQERIGAVTIPFGPKELDAPFYRQLEGRPIFLVVHLFSGRRRHHDFHERLHQLVKGKPFDVHVLSLDTAIDKSYGNLAASSVTWARLYSLLRIGAIAAGLAGPPCETFSAARYYQPSEEELKQSNGRPWPRPLRDSTNPWGLEGLSIREVRQLSVGSAFALQTLVVLVWLLVQGGSFLVEHPAPSKDEWKVSLFRTTIAMLLRSLPEVQFEIFCQGDWGATSTKPTGILALRPPTIRTSMFRWRAPTPLDARETAIGKSNGEFRTKHLKEYPEPFAAGLAQCVADSLQRKHQKGATRACNPCADDMAWISTVLEVVTHICEDGVMMPDYQPGL